jgi:hypothetical protein
MAVTTKKQCDLSITRTCATTIIFLMTEANFKELPQHFLDGNETTHETPHLWEVPLTLSILYIV